MFYKNGINEYNIYETTILEEAFMYKRLLVAVLAVLLLLAGCSKDEKADTQEIFESQDKDSQSIKGNNELTEQLMNEEGVKDGQVYEEGRKAIGKIVLESNVSDAEAEELVKKYAEKLKEVYGEKELSIQAERAGKNVASYASKPDTTAERGKNSEENSSDGTEERIKLSSLSKNQYEIVTDMEVLTDLYYVNIYIDQLPEAIKDVKKYTLSLGGKEYIFTQNEVNSNVFTAEIPNTIEVDHISTGELLVKK